MKFTSNKIIDLGSTAFRQWRSTHSHCQYIHGYNLTADITFECDELDDKNWVADFGGLKELKKTLEYTFDHKLVVAGDDPHLDLLKMLDETGVAQIIVLEGGVGCERFAEFVLKTADTFIDEDTNGRVRVKSVQINEHEKNFATAHRVEDTLEVTITQSNSEPVDIDAIEAAEARINVIGKNGNDGDHYEKEGLEDVHGPIATKASLQPPAQKPSTKTKGGWFDGTTWG
jgi:6-pyruvoyltetrahydropterin/6-carboxytetrahydropterin synthase